MILSQTTEYALRTLALMSQDERATYSSTVLHRRLGIPRKYLQRLLTDLTKSGLIKSVRGRNGGYVFARSITRIYLAQIIDAVEGFEREPSCFFGFRKCPVGDPCAMHDVWSAAQVTLIQALSTTRLADLVAKRK
jgi:Rrf2 family transcriptional regulator, iron-sulfur cluster assembly transcription factor